MLGPALEHTLPTGTGRVVEGWWTSTSSGAGTIVPDGAIDVIWTPGRAPFVAGPDREPRPVGLAAGAPVVGVRLRTGVVMPVLGDGADRAVGCAVSLTEVWTRPEIDQLADDLATAPDAAARSRVLATAVARRVPPDWEPDPVVVDVIASIAGGDTIGERDLGSRQLRRRFSATIGYGPALYRRIVRLDRFTAMLSHERDASLADLAVRAGFCDQAHLNRDCRRLLGTTPASLRAAA